MDYKEMAGHLIRRLHQQSSHLFQVNARAAGFDLTPVQFAAMGALRANPGIDQATVAALIAYDRATIGGVIDRLVQKALVARVISRRDRRARELSLTAAGEASYAAILPVVQSFQDDILACLTADERAQFLALARKATLAAG